MKNLKGKSTEARIEELRRDLEKQRVSHKLLKAKVTQLAKRLRTLEPFIYAEERDLFCLYLYEFRKFLQRRNDRWPMKEMGPTRTP